MTKEIFVVILNVVVMSVSEEKIFIIKKKCKSN